MSESASAAATSPEQPPQPPIPPLDPLAGLYSYLIPGLGQCTQGRWGKGLLFFFGLYGLFFYGMAMGQWSNVYLPDSIGTAKPFWSLPKPVANLISRWQFPMQAGMGIVTWPAIYHYATDDGLAKRDDINASLWNFAKGFEKAPSEEEINTLQRDGDKRWDLGLVYTMVAGMLNLLVIYDAIAGPAILVAPEPEKAAKP